MHGATLQWGTGFGKELVIPEGSRAWSVACPQELSQSSGLTPLHHPACHCTGLKGFPLQAAPETCRQASPTWRSHHLQGPSGQSPRLLLPHSAGVQTNVTRPPPWRPSGPGTTLTSCVNLFPLTPAHPVPPAPGCPAVPSPMHPQPHSGPHTRFPLPRVRAPVPCTPQSPQ